MKISLIGVGRLGGALAIALSEKKDFRVEKLFARNSANAEKIAELIEPKPQILNSDEFSKIDSDVIFITTPDSEIETVAANLAKNLKTAPVVFHASGSLSSKNLEKLQAIGCQTGSLHPLVSISDALLGSKRFDGAFFCVEGDAEAVSVAEKIVEKLGGKSFSIAAEYKTLYHAAAVTACGHLVALLDAALEMLEKCGLSEVRAQEILLPLVKSTVENLQTQTTARALTGTFARADLQTLERQIAVLSETISPEAFEIYLLLGNRSLDLAKRRAAGANRQQLELMRETISLAKKNIKC